MPKRQKKALTVQTSLARQHQEQQLLRQQQQQKPQRVEPESVQPEQSQASHNSQSANSIEEQPSSAEVEKLTSMMGSIHNNNNNTFVAINKDTQQGDGQKVK